MHKSEHPRTVIEFMDHPGSDLCHKTVKIHINGTPVMVARDGIDIEFDSTGSAATEVILRLLPTEIHFTRLPAEHNVPDMPKE